MKKNPYIKPAMQVVMLKQKHSLLTASEESTEESTTPTKWGSKNPNEYWDAD